MKRSVVLEVFSVRFFTTSSQALTIPWGRGRDTSKDQPLMLVEMRYYISFPIGDKPICPHAGIFVTYRCSYQGRVYFIPRHGYILPSIHLGPMPITLSTVVVT